METKKTSSFRKFFTKRTGDEQSAEHALKDLCIYFLFLLFATIVTMSSREIGMYYFNHTIERLFLHRVTLNKHKNELTYEDLLTVDDWWAYTKTTFIDSIGHFKHKDSPNELAIGGNILLGVPRLRQIRIQNESCEVDKVFENEFKTCYGHYSTGMEDVGGFADAKHFSQADVNTNTVWGTITRYRGAGYIKVLSFDKEKNEDILSKLEDAIWVDQATRVILIEFALFNANVNLFCNAKLLAEIPATGGVVTSSQLQTVKHSSLWNEGGFFVPFCSVILLGLIFYYTLEAIREIISIGSISYFSSVFKLLDIIILVIAYLSIIYIIWHSIYVKSILNKYAENQNQYISLDIICFWNLIFIDAMGICVFLVWIQIFKYIKFNKTMMQFSTTLRRCAKDLLGFSIMFAIVFIAFAFLSVMLFGSVDSSFCEFSNALLALMRTVLGDFDYEKLEAANRVLGPIFFLSFILLVFFILMNMFLAIINDTYSDVKSEITQGQGNQFEEYIQSLLAKLKSIIRPAKKKDYDDNDDNDLEKQTEEKPEVSRPSVKSRRSTQTRPLLQSKPSDVQRLRTWQDIFDK